MADSSPAPPSASWGSPRSLRRSPPGVRALRSVAFVAPAAPQYNLRSREGRNVMPAPHGDEAFATPPRSACEAARGPSSSTASAASSTASSTASSSKASSSRASSSAASRRPSVVPPPPPPPRIRRSSPRLLDSDRPPDGRLPEPPGGTPPPRRPTTPPRSSLPPPPRPRRRGRRRGGGPDGSASAERRALLEAARGGDGEGDGGGLDVDGSGSGRSDGAIDACDEDVYAHLAEFGRRLDDELTDLEELGVEVSSGAGDRGGETKEKEGEATKGERSDALEGESNAGTSRSTHRRRRKKEEERNGRGKKKVAPPVPREICRTPAREPSGGALATPESSPRSPSGPSSSSSRASPPRFRRSNDRGSRPPDSGPVFDPGLVDPGRRHGFDGSFGGSGGGRLGASRRRGSGGGSISSWGSSQSQFSSSAVRAAVAARIAARERREAQETRARGSPPGAPEGGRSRRLGGSPKRPDDFADVVAREGRGGPSRSSSRGRPTEGREEMMRREYEVLLHPDVEDGVAEAAAWHLHGRTGGRRPHPHREHCRVMDSDAVLVARDRGGDDDAGDEGFGGAKLDPASVAFDVEDGVAVLSASRTSSPSSRSADRSSPDDLRGGEEDAWSAGVAAAVVAGVAARHRKACCLFPHGRAALIPLFVGAAATSLSLATLLSCRFATIVPEHGAGRGGPGVGPGGTFRAGPWRYLSVNPSSSDGEVCLPYPSEMVADPYFATARSCAALASCLGIGTAIWTCTLLCVPAGRGSLTFLGTCFAICGVAQCLTATLYASDDCRRAEDDAGGRGERRGYFGGGECRPDRDLVFCVAAAVLYLTAGWILGCASSRDCFVGFRAPGRGSAEVHTWSSEAKSSDPGNGVLRTVEKSWTTVPNGSTLVATVHVERTREGDAGGAEGEKKIKTTYSIQTEIFPA